MPATPIRLGLTYDDVLLVPKRSPVLSRKDITITAQLSKHIRLNNPIISANMDTVTEAPMAIAMARQGGIGFIHRFLTVDQQVHEVQKVKRWSHVVVPKPYTLPVTATLQDVWEEQERRGVSSFVIVDGQGKVAGILTARDLWMQTDPSKTVGSLMTPRERLIIGPPNISQDEAKKILYQHKIEKLPLVYDDGSLFGLLTLDDIRKRETYPMASKDSQGRLLVGAAVGVKDDYLARTQALIEAGADVIVVDVAHGHSDIAMNAVKDIRQTFPSIELIAGNIASAEGAKDLIALGVDGLKVGVGPGSMCTTRVVTGAGVPQITAIMDCAVEAQKHQVPIIADGGIRFSGDVTKALAAGADTVMIGNLFAGTDESPGRVITRAGRKVKLYRGMASRDASQSRLQKLSAKFEADVVQALVPEGVEAIVPYRGSVQETVHQLLGGLRSGMSYCGATNMQELHTNAEFIQITAAGWKESQPHDAEITT